MLPRILGGPGSTDRNASGVLLRPRLRKRVFYALVAFASALLLVLASFLLWLVEPRAVLTPWLAAAAALAWGVFWERRWLEVTGGEVVLEGLPAALDGFRVVQISDVHWDAYTDPAWVLDVIERVNGMDADVVALTGDLVTHFRQYIPPCARALGRLRARRGVFAVLGNHDHWAGGRILTDALEREGIQVLSNRHVWMDGFWLVGVDDPHVQRDDLTRALDGIGLDGLPRVLLAHSPDIMEDAVGKVSLVLSGHTHGGQVRVPGVGAMLHATRFPAGKRFTVGWGQEGTTVCYTNRGLGSVLIPIRFNCRPEVAVITLRARKPPEQSPAPYR